MQPVPRGRDLTDPESHTVDRIHTFFFHKYVHAWVPLYAATFCFPGMTPSVFHSFKSRTSFVPFSFTGGGTSGVVVVVGSDDPSDIIVEPEIGLFDNWGRVSLVRKNESNSLFKSNTQATTSNVTRAMLHLKSIWKVTFTVIIIYSPTSHFGALTEFLFDAG